MNWIEALILGVVQGITEFLPISSSGHLQIGVALFDINAKDNLAFVIVVHFATVCSTVVVFWSVIIKLLAGLFKFTWNNETEYIAKLIVSMIPIAIVGVFFKSQIEEIFGSGLTIVGICLLVTALLLTFAHFAKPRIKKKISFFDSFIIGISQAVAVLPGLSRSGSTIATGLLLGNKRENIAQFSFLMVLAPVVGEMLLDFCKGGFSENLSISTTALITGFIGAFISGLLACRLMISIVKRGKLIWFAVYCIAAGVLALVL